MINSDSHINITLTKKNKSKIVKLSILSLNCHSVRSQFRRALLQSIMEEHQADIVIGCESHLDNSFSSQEIFPPQYVMRKDRCIGGGCVFLALKNHLTFVDEPSFHGNAGCHFTLTIKLPDIVASYTIATSEMVWVKLCLNKSKPIYVYSLYRPPASSSETLFELNNILTTIHECSVSPAILLAGDFNLPDLKLKMVLAI